MALLDVELPHRVGDVDDLDLRGGYASCGKCAGSGLLDEVADLQRLLGEVAGEIALVAADDPDILLHRHVRSSRMRSGSVHAKPEMRSGSVAARTSASVTPGAHSTSRRPSSVTSRTARSVMMRSTTRSPVSGNEHSLTILKSPFLARCSMRMMTRRAPWTRSMAPPMPLIILPGIVQLARSPAAETCMAPRIAASILPERIIPKLAAESKKLAPDTTVTVSLPALIRSGSWCPSKGYRPVPRMPFSDCRTSSMSESR